MIVCPNCGRENEDHYKFCLGCGTELSKPKGDPDTGIDVGPPIPTAIPQAAPEPEPVPEPEPEPEASVSSEMADPADGDASAEQTIDPDLPADEPEGAPTLAVSRDELEAAMAAEAEGPSTSEQPLADEATVAPDLDDIGVEADEDAPTDPPAEDEAPSAVVVTRTPHASSAPEPVEDDDDVVMSPAPPGMDAPTADPEPAPAPALDEESTSSGAPEPQSDARICRSCGAVVPEGFRFCGVCGTRYGPEESAPAPAAPAFVPRMGEEAAEGAQLVVIRPDGSEGDRFALADTETTIGRAHPSPIFAQDPFLSPRHCTFVLRQGQLLVRDESSLNGVFVRIKAEVELFHGDMFRIGQELLSFEEMSQMRPVLPGAGDGTIVMGSPARGTWGRVSAVVALDTHGSVWTLRKPEVIIGRERGDIVFPEDGFVSGSHCNVSMRSGRYFLVDLGSSNGTYLRIKGEGLLGGGDLILLGQQLFKIELPD